MSLDASVPSQSPLLDARSVGFAVVGCGGIGNWHARAIESLPGCELRAMADTGSDALSRAVRRFGVEGHASVEDLLDRSDVHVVSICTPPESHADLVEISATAGKHVLVEKPLALDLGDAERAIRACTSAGVHLGVAYQQRTRSAARTLYSLIADGALGVASLAIASHSWYRTAQQLEGSGWRADVKTGGGLLLDQAIHAVDLLIWFLGQPEWVAGTMSGCGQPGGAETGAAAVIGFRSGAIATLAASTVASGVQDTIFIEVLGTRGRGRLALRDYDHAEITHLELATEEGKRARRLGRREIEEIVQGHDGRWRQGPQSPLWRLAAAVAGRNYSRLPFRSPRAFLGRRVDRAAQLETGELQGHAGILAAMARAARGEGTPVVTGEEAWWSLAVVLGIHHSERAGGRRVPTPAPTDR